MAHDLTTDEGLDAAVRGALAKRTYGAFPLTIATAIGLEAAGDEPEARANHARVEASLARVGMRGRFGEWLPRPTPAPVERRPDFDLPFLGTIWTRCWMDKPARPAGLEEEFSHCRPQLRDALQLLELAGLIQLVVVRRREKWVATSRDAGIEYKAARLVLCYVQERIDLRGLIGAADIAAELRISQDTAEALVRGLAEEAQRLTRSKAFAQRGGNLTASLLASLRLGAPEVFDEADTRELHRLRADTDRAEAEEEDRQFDEALRAFGLAEAPEAPEPCHVNPFGEPNE